MITIRKEQVQKLGEFVKENFEINTIKHLKEKYPEKTKTMNNDKMIDFIHTGIINAEKHNIIERRDISVYLEYIMIHGEGFETNPENEWAFKVFRIKNLSGEEKIKRLLQNNPI